MPSELVVLSPADTLETLIGFLTQHTAFDFWNCAVALDCDGTLTDLDHPSGTVVLRGGAGTRRFLQWLNHSGVPWFVVSARATNAQSTLEVAQTLVTLGIPRPKALEDSFAECVNFRGGEEIFWFPQGPSKPAHVGLACGNVVASVAHTGAHAALPKTLSIQFAIEEFLDRAPQTIVLVEDAFENVSDLYMRYKDDPDVYMICVYYPRPIALPDSDIESMTQLLPHVTDLQDRQALQLLQQQAMAIRSREQQRQQQQTPAAPQAAVGGLLQYGTPPVPMPQSMPQAMTQAMTQSLPPFPPFFYHQQQQAPPPLSYYYPQPLSVPNPSSFATSPIPYYYHPNY